MGYWYRYLLWLFQGSAGCGWEIKETVFLDIIKDLLHTLDELGILIYLSCVQADSTTSLQLVLYKYLLKTLVESPSEGWLLCEVHLLLAFGVHSLRSLIFVS